MRRLLLAVFLLLALDLLWFGSAPAQAVCDNVAAPTSSVCGPNNSLSWDVPLTNVDGSPLTNLSSFRVVFGPNATLCSAQGVPTVGTTVRNLGNLSIPPTPLASVRASTKLSALALPNALVFTAPQILNAVGTVGGCATPVQFTFQGSVPPTPANVNVN